MWSDLLLILDATLRMAVPLVLAAMGGVFAERSGVIDFGLEGKMLGGAFVAATVAHLTQSAWMGLLGAIIIGITFSMMHAFASVLEKAALPARDIERIVHGTTVATNALIQRHGADIAFITTAGFEDIPFIQRTNRKTCLLYTSPSPRDATLSRMPSSA